MAENQNTGVQHRRRARPVAQSEIDGNSNSPEQLTTVAQQPIRSSTQVADSNQLFQRIINAYDAEESLESIDSSSGIQGERIPATVETVWHPDDEEGFVMGHVKAKEGPNVTVELLDSGQVTISSSTKAIVDLTCFLFVSLAIFFLFHSHLCYDFLFVSLALSFCLHPHSTIIDQDLQN